ncbi:MAG: molecular chaperone SurA [Proteobacteria bacterium]|nr:MAG: molecular chaperone SurA [Pseudomonadota bacterium]PIE40302.1 MAG: molecular chaperone SurA [Gammaproteobacteria bacterium]
MITVRMLQSLLPGMSRVWGRGYIGAGILAMALAVPAHTATLLDQVVAIVEDGVVLQSELENRIATIVSRLKAQNTPLPDRKVMREKVLDQLILEQIQLQMARKMGLRVSDAELTDAINSIARRNGYSLKAFARAIESEGITFAQMRQQVRTEMLLGRLQQKRVAGRVRVTDSQVANFLQSAAGRSKTSTEYLLGHILLAFPASPTTEQIEEKRKEAREIVAKIRQGADFRQMAVARSDGHNALQGGVLGWRKESDLPTLATELVPAMSVGEVSDPVQTPSGFHLITVLDKKGGKSKIVTQYLVRHLLLKENELRSLSEAKVEIDKLYERIREGESFAELARSFSEDPISGAEGGLLGWVGPGEMVALFESVMAETPVGVVSAPFKTPFGWHILEVSDTRQKDIGEQVQEGKAREILHRKEFDIQLQKWLREIREEAYVEIKETGAS